MMKKVTLLILIFFALLFGCQSDDNDEPINDIPAVDQDVPSCKTEVFFDEETLLFSIEGEDCDTAWYRVSSYIAVIQNGLRVWHPLSKWPANALVQNGNEATWSFSGHPRLPDVELAFKENNGGIILDVTMIAGQFIEVDGIRFYGLIALPMEPPALHYLHNGYDSWTYTGVAKIVPTDEPMVFRDGAELPFGNNYGYWMDKKAISWWTTAIRGPVLKPGLVAGALTGDLFKTYFSAGYHRTQKVFTLSLISGTPHDLKALDKGQTLSFDTFYFLTTKDPVRGLIKYAESVAEKRPALKWNGFSPEGWASWYDFFGHVSEKLMLENLAIMKDRYLNYGFEVCQLDDGYMTKWGDWQSVNERFPSGLEFLANQIEAAGLVPGIWMAPLMADEDSEIAQLHPDWFLKNDNGRFLYLLDFFMGKKITLDITHPEAAKWVSEQIQQMVEIGYRYLKIDFLFVGAVEADRYDNSVTSLQAYAIACRIIADAAGPDVYLLASGQPFLPSAGRFHAARTSSDICGSPVDAPTWKMVHNIARYNAARFFSDGHFFDNDPDQLLVRPPLTIEKAQMALASNILLGSNLWLGDDLTDLDNEREKLILSDLANYFRALSGTTIPLDLFDEASERVVNFPYSDYLFNASRTPKIYLKQSTLVLINWNSATDKVDVTLDQLGYKSDTGIRIIDRESGEIIEAVDGKFAFILPGTTMKIFDIH